MKHGKAWRLGWILYGCWLAASSLASVHAQEPPASQSIPSPSAFQPEPTAAAAPSQAPATLAALQQRLEQAQHELRALQARRYHILKTMLQIEQRMLTSPRREAGKRSSFSEKRFRPSA
jgi:hypothetical protein